MSTLGWSVSEKDTEWKLASDVTCRGEKLTLRAATVRGWQPHPGVPSRTCLATLLRVLMTGMLGKPAFSLIGGLSEVRSSLSRPRPPIQRNAAPRARGCGRASWLEAWSPKPHHLGDV
ncbi:hypothetical protein EYF80_007094 [Liparis tanakae]|uniref:Uncharacterized protein n=1 Tax=Liparis tanakae TaxID=230148 RepID=A0A4Z2IXH0_9TELE|nr:hypothetical protein EYF80_007094 [Liparis tanakae]